MLPCSEDGTLDEYITEEAEENEKSFDEMKQEFWEKRKSDYNTLSIESNSVSFHTPSGTVSAEYEYQGFQTVKDDDGDITSLWYFGANTTCYRHHHVVWLKRFTSLLSFISKTTSLYSKHGFASHI